MKYSLAKNIKELEQSFSKKDGEQTSVLLVARMLGHFKLSVTEATRIVKIARSKQGKAL